MSSSPNSSGAQGRVKMNPLAKFKRNARIKEKGRKKTKLILKSCTLMSNIPYSMLIRNSKHQEIIRERMIQRYYQTSCLPFYIYSHLLTMLIVKKANFLLQNNLNRIEFQNTGVKFKTVSGIENFRKITYEFHFFAI